MVSSTASVKFEKSLDRLSVRRLLCIAGMTYLVDTNTFIGMNQCVRCVCVHVCVCRSYAFRTELGKIVILKHIKDGYVYL